ncbi:hemin uptake protein HemP [Nevskia soli]|uniref:hemin uptake protein HemP n=1 Tax=Nevskia soli TaxID=418856 RepID=UPI0004A6C282|nr:hemin uptake protein HemP [Nevskia soli]
MIIIIIKYMSQTKPLSTAATPAPQRPPANVPQFDSQALFGAARELLIRHDGALYRLRLTRAGKLILTK